MRKGQWSSLMVVWILHYTLYIKKKKKVFFVIMHQKHYSQIKTNIL